MYDFLHAHCISAAPCTPSDPAQGCVFSSQMCITLPAEILSPFMHKYEEPMRLFAARMALASSVLFRGYWAMHCALLISDVVLAPVSVSAICRSSVGGLNGISRQVQGRDSHLCVPCGWSPFLRPSPESATAASQTALAHCPRVHALIRSASAASSPCIAGETGQ